MDASGQLSQLVPVSTNTLQYRVYQTLRNTLLDGQFLPGEVFTIRALADVIGTSVMPVREALARLDAEGAVEIRHPGRQTSIPIMSRDSVTELYRVRSELEGMAARMAARRITPAEIGAIEPIIGQMQEALDTREVDQFLRANRAFHFAIYHAAQSHHLMPIIESLWLKLGPLLRVSLGPDAQAGGLVDGGQPHHERALAALRSGDEEAACAAIRSDLADTGAWFEANYHPEAVAKLSAVRHSD